MNASQFIAVTLIGACLIGPWLINRASVATFYMFLAALLLFGLAEKFGVLNLVS
jgi:hypothetical protein